ncbi:MAG: 1-acyl-sn-glycerol-3-phosphate acyltransferase [Glaciihabitans sp.]|nr:1-acyl-sn-glycerol-3-phosphate acyltransferase [Glaciihabitans sp.]
MTVGVPRSSGYTAEASEPEHDRFNSPLQAAARFVAQRGLLRPLIWSLVRVTIIDVDRVKNVKGGFIVVANHSSHLDTPLIMGSLPRKMARYLAAGAAADYFFDVWWRRGLTALFFNAFPVRRVGSSKHSVSARSLLLRGIPLLIFPEGTRSKDGQFGPFKPGAAALATACDVPVIPMALIGVHIAHPRGTNWPRRGRLPVGVVFGEPMVASPGETSLQFAGRISDAISRLRDQHAASILGEHTPSKGANK